MADSVRNIVSKKKKRFQQDGFDLDLSYITPRIIAMGFPSTGTEAMYRNPMSEVQKFFAKYHPGHFKIYNLCSERSYEPASFQGHCARYPFNDHNACPLKLIPDFVTDASTFLSLDPQNVVAVHCKAGKGRTGMMVSCLLLAEKIADNASSALDKFAEERTENKAGVTIPSQIRYVDYYHKVLNYSKPPFPYDSKPLWLKKLTLHGHAPEFDTGGGCDPFFTVSTAHGMEIYNMRRAVKKIVHYQGDGDKELPCKIPVSGDFIISVYDADVSGDELMFSFWLHSAMLTSSPLKLTKTELDHAVKDKGNKQFTADFYVTLEFEGMDPKDFKGMSIQQRQSEYNHAGSGLSNKLRGLVSQKKIRFQKDGFDLDLTYITDRIIAMGFPSSGTEAMYRNSMKDVQKFFVKYHPGHYKVYNLCAERVYKPAEFTKHSGEVAHYPFQDHNPPPFNLIQQFVADVQAFMAKDPANIVAVHCKAGKGRTGMMIASLLIALQEVSTAEEALEYFGLMRTANAKGVTIPSQMRYVRYFEQYLSLLDGKFQLNELSPLPDAPSKLLQLTNIKLSGAPPNMDAGGGCDPYFKVLRIFDNQVLYDSKKSKGAPKVTHWGGQELERNFPCSVYLSGDIKITFYDQDRLDKDDKMFALVFNTGFIKGKRLRLNKNDLDKAVKDKSNKVFEPDFACLLEFEKLGQIEYKEHATPYATTGYNIEKKKKKDVANRIKGLVSKKKRRFQQEGFDLDLSYITPRIIAMGFPSTGTEGFYRNNMKDVKRFFLKYHENHFKVYNLCAERVYDKANWTDIGGEFGYYPFQDHNPCAMSMMEAICIDAEEFLKADEKNVVAIHCKAGKGRTGMIASALLVHTDENPTAQSALAFYANQRTLNKKGVTIPSQIRYVHYFNLWKTQFKNSKRFDWSGDEVVFKGFKMNVPPNFDVGGGCDPYFKLEKPVPGKKGEWGAQVEQFFNMKKTHKVRSYRKGELVMKDFDVKIKGDVKMTFYDKDMMGSHDKMLALWFHTSFLTSNEVVFRKLELDKACKDKTNDKFPKEFELTLYFEGVPKKNLEEIPPPPDYPSDSEDEGDGGGEESEEEGNVPPPPDEDPDEDMVAMQFSDSDATDEEDEDGSLRASQAVGRGTRQLSGSNITEGEVSSPTSPGGKFRTADDMEDSGMGDMSISPSMRESMMPKKSVSPTDSKVHREGYLRKKSPRNGKMQLRYFVLDGDNNVLRYYKKKPGAYTQATGMLALPHVLAAEVTGDSSFDITDRGRVYHLQIPVDQPEICKPNDSAQAWVTVITQAIPERQDAEPIRRGNVLYTRRKFWGTAQELRQLAVDSEKKQLLVYLPKSMNRSGGHYYNTKPRLKLLGTVEQSDIESVRLSEDGYGFTLQVSSEKAPLVFTAESAFLASHLCKGLQQLISSK